jgi:hypothetical protein
MEPITYLVGLFTIGCGYAFFLYVSTLLILSLTKAQSRGVVLVHSGHERLIPPASIVPQARS